jgi:hypothetical protein
MTYFNVFVGNLKNMGKHGRDFVRQLMERIESEVE